MRRNRDIQRIPKTFSTTPTLRGDRRDYRSHTVGETPTLNQPLRGLARFRSTRDDFYSFRVSSGLWVDGEVEVRVHECRGLYFSFKFCLRT